MRGTAWLWCGLVLMALFAGGGCPGPLGVPQSRFNLVADNNKKLHLEFAGLSEQERKAVAELDTTVLSMLFEVRVADAGKDVPNVAGSVSFVDGKLRFEPRYPFAKGVTYEAVVHRMLIPGNGKNAEDVTEGFGFEEAIVVTPTKVAHVYPSAEKLPENLLKFYLHFSAPMSRGEAYRRIHLLDGDGKEVADPFLELGEELWDADMKRFTLLFDPGRIKRGLKPREEVGPVLEEGKRYTLVVDRDWLDASGHPLTAEVRKSFSALAPDEAPLDVDAWKIESPAAGTRDPLVVRFPEPLDHSLLTRVVKVVDAADQEVAGEIEIADAEMVWRFTPEHAWEKGDYRVAAATTLEDLAGNSIGRAFDVDLFEPVQKQIATDKVTLPFGVQ